MGFWGLDVFEQYADGAMLYEAETGEVVRGSEEHTSKPQNPKTPYMTVKFESCVIKSNMGNCSFKNDRDSNEIPCQVTTKNQFLRMYVIGKGGFGRVWKIQEKRSGQQFAMKEMSKQRILSK